MKEHETELARLRTMRDEAIEAHGIRDSEVMSLELEIANLQIKRRDEALRAFDPFRIGYGESLDHYLLRSAWMAAKALLDEPKEVDHEVS